MRHFLLLVGLSSSGVPYQFTCSTEIYLRLTVLTCPKLFAATVHFLRQIGEFRSLNCSCAGLLLSDEDNDVRCGARAAARALGASSDNPEPLFDSFLSLSRTMRSIPKRAGLMRVVSAVIGAS